MPPKPQKGFREPDFRTGLALVTAFALHYAIVALFPAASDYFNICILGICSAYIAEMSAKATWRAGVMRLLITSIGAVAALIPAAVFDLTQSEALLVVVAGALAVAVLVVAKYSGAVYAQCRLAIVSYVLGIYIFHAQHYAAMGKTSYFFAASWVASTVVGVLAATAAMLVWDLAARVLKRE